MRCRIDSLCSRLAGRRAAVPHLPDNRSPLAAAWARASQVTAASLEMVVPIVAGYFLDQWLGTRWVFVVLGAAARVGGGDTQLGIAVAAKRRQR